MGGGRITIHNSEFRIQNEPLRREERRRAHDSVVVGADLLGAR